MPSETFSSICSVSGVFSPSELKLVLNFLLLNDCFWSFLECCLAYWNSFNQLNRIEQKNEVWYINFFHQRWKMEMAWFLLDHNPVKKSWLWKKTSPNKPHPGDRSSKKFCSTGNKVLNFITSFVVFVAWKYWFSDDGFSAINLSAETSLLNQCSQELLSGWIC